MTKSQALKAIDKAYYRLAGCCDHTDEWDRYVALNWAEEKSHRQFCPSFITPGLTKAQAVRLFAVKEVFERFIPNESGRVFTPEAKDYFSIRGSVFGACAIAHKCELEILKEFPRPEMVQWLKSIDYVELNKDPQQKAA